MGFYFVGIVMALLAINNSIKEKLKIIFKKPVAFIIVNVVFMFLLIFIIVRPSIWEAASAFAVSNRIGTWLVRSSDFMVWQS